MKNPDLVRIFIGYDHRETVAFNVLTHCINTLSSLPVSIYPINLHHLTQIFHREKDPKQSTDFSFSRFLAPYLSSYKGWSIFMDCDMLLRDDIANLWALRDERYAVMCVKHDHRPKNDTKFLNEPQTRYEKKNWSSVMLLNNPMCRALTPSYVNEATGLELHQFKWLESDDLIGCLPPEWNHLVGWNKPNPAAKLIHFTEGGPYFNEYRNCEFADQWCSAEQAVLHRQQDDSLAQKPTHPISAAHKQSRQT